MTQRDEAFGRRIQRARERKGWSQAELARQLRASAYAVNLLEQGKTPTPRADRIVALCQCLEVSSDWLLGLQDDVQGELLPNGRVARDDLGSHRPFEY